MPRSAIINVFRSADYFGDRNAFYKVSIDGVVVGEVWERQSKYFDVKPGQHTVQMKTYYLKSNALVVSVEADQTVRLARRGRDWVARTFGPYLPWRPYLNLRLVTPEDSALMSEIAAQQPPPPTPRNLGAN